jgi:L-fuconolactonase
VGGAYRPVEDYVAVMDRLGIDGAVLVQSQTATDNNYIRECLARFPTRFAAVGWLGGEDATPAAIESLAADGFRGVRLAPIDDQASLSDPIWAAVERTGLVVSVLPRLEVVTSDAFATLVIRHPGTTFRLEHLGGLQHPAAEDPVAGDRLSRFLALAAYPNTCTTWSGLWLNSPDGYPYTSAFPTLKDSVRAFGADRIMWSGDWNHAGQTDETYVRESEVVQRVVGDGNQAAAILRGTCRRVFGLGSV